MHLIARAGLPFDRLAIVLAVGGALASVCCYALWRIVQSARKMTRNTKQIAGAGAALVALVGVASATMIVLLAQGLDSHSQSLATASCPTPGSNQSEFCLNVNSIDPVDGTLDALIQVYVPLTTVRSFDWTASTYHCPGGRLIGEWVGPRAPPIQLTLVAAGVSAPLAMQIPAPQTCGNYNLPQITTASSGVAASSDVETSATHVVIPISGNPKLLPFDSFHATIGVSEALPAGVTLNASHDFPVAMQLVRSTGLTQFHVDWSNEPSLAASTGSEVQWQLHLRRQVLDTLYRLFVVVVTAVLAVGVYFTLQNAEDQTGVMGVAAAVLALITVRAIIVPDGYPTPTLIDAMLLVVFTFTVATTVWKAVELHKPRLQRQASAPQSGSSDKHDVERSTNPGPASQGAETLAAEEAGGSEKGEDK